MTILMQPLFKLARDSDVAVFAGHALTKFCRQFGVELAAQHLSYWTTSLRSPEPIICSGKIKVNIIKTSTLNVHHVH